MESYDPILNPVLNREVRKTGGRVLITLGDQDIDLSPSFTIFLSTRDPSVEFAPDLCSRVTFVNFTVTRSSLQSQCLNRVSKRLSTGSLSCLAAYDEFVSSGFEIRETRC